MPFNQQNSCQEQNSKVDCRSKKYTSDSYIELPIPTSLTLNNITAQNNSATISTPATVTFFSQAPNKICCSPTQTLKSNTISQFSSISTNNTPATQNSNSTNQQLLASFQIQ